MIDTTADESLEPTMTLRNSLGRMTAAERAAGRYLRAPDGHDGDDAGAGGEDQGQDNAGDKGADEGDQSNGNDQADKAADDAQGDKQAEEGKDKSLMGRSDDKKDEPDPATLPPEKYELTAPEGFTLDETVMAEADPIFREIGLTNEQADKLMPLAGKFAERLAAQQNDAFQAMKTDWAKQAMADPDLGGANWKRTEANVAKALDAFGAPKDSDFRKLLDETGLGNHPEMIRMFSRIGDRMGEGADFARGDTGAQVKKTREEVLYGAEENRS